MRPIQRRHIRESAALPGKWADFTQWIRALGLFFALCVVPKARTGAQADRIDAGSFSISVDGQRVGREQFVFRRAPAPDGVAFELRSEGSLGDRRTSYRLEADSAGSPVRYTVEIRNAGALAMRFGGQRTRGRFATLARRPNGETAREYLLLPGVVVVEADCVHQFALLMRGRTGKPGEVAVVPLLSPLDGAAGELRIVLETPGDSVTIAGVPRRASRWRVQSRDGLIRTVWTDIEGRLLRVSIPARSLDAIRDDAPR